MPDLPPDCPYALLTDLLSAHNSASEFGGGLEPQLLELLLDRQARHDGAHRIAPPVDCH